MVLEEEDLPCFYNFDCFVVKISWLVRQHCCLTICRLVGFVAALVSESEANPNNNLMMSRAGLSMAIGVCKYVGLCSDLKPSIKSIFLHSLFFIYVGRV